MATPTPEDRQTQDGTPFKWSDYVQKVSSTIFAHHDNATRIICVNDPYNTAYSTKDNERDLRVQGRTYVPNTYMKFNDPFPSARAFKTLLCSTSNKGRLQNLICRHLTDLAQSVHAEIIYSVGSDCTNLSTQEPMPDNAQITVSVNLRQTPFSFLPAYTVLRNSGYNEPVVIDSADTDAYVAAAAISQKFPGLLCIKRKQDTILCRNLVPEEMASCIVPLHCLTGCDANSGFFGKGKLSVYDKVARSAEARELLSKCGNSLDIEEEAIEELFKFTRTVIYNDKISKTTGTARAAKWKAMKKK